MVATIDGATADTEGGTAARGGIDGGAEAGTDTVGTEVDGDAAAFALGKGAFRPSSAEAGDGFSNRTAESIDDADFAGCLADADSSTATDGDQPAGGTTSTKLPHLGHSRIAPIAAASRTASLALHVVQAM